jgi:hypothetical protein
MNQTLSPFDVKPLTPQRSLTHVCDPASFGDSLHNLIENGYTQWTSFQPAKILGLPVKRRQLNAWRSLHLTIPRRLARPPESCARQTGSWRAGSDVALLDGAIEHLPPSGVALEAEGR